MDRSELTAAEAAARLGIKRSTLYAYVSRGLVTRHVAMDGRTSLFDAAEIDAFRLRKRRASEGELDTVLSTVLTHVSDGDVTIRGRRLVDMALDGVGYEAAAEWLWSAGKGDWRVAPETAAASARVQVELPEAVSMIDRLRTTVAVVSASDPMRFDASPAGVHALGRQLVTAMVHALPVVGAAQTEGRLADALWVRLTPRRGSRARRDALEVALVLLIDHGIAASTFAVRIAASVRADPYSGVMAGLGVVGGSLHGAASGEVHRLLDHAHAQSDAAAAIGDAQRRSGSVPGFGHAVYRTEDPRYSALMGVVSTAWRNDPRLGIVHEVRDLVARRTDRIPNVDLALGALTWLSSMDPDAGEAIFAVSRTAGWLAHTVEEYGEPPGRFRPRARFVGTRAEVGRT